MHQTGVQEAVDNAIGRLAYSPAEVAEALGVTRQHVHNLMARGELASVKVGRCRRIPASVLDALLRGGTNEAA